MKRSLERLLRPRSIAVFGGSWAASVIDQCQKMQFDGDIWPVHPDRDQMYGLPCYRSIDELPAPPDASFVGVNRMLSIKVVKALAKRGAGGAVCFASGFDEAGGRDAAGKSLQQGLIDAAGAMPVIGPNCYGLINYLDGALLWPDQHGGRRLGSDSRGVALLLQSSNIAINLTMQQRSLPIAYVVCLGNQAQTDCANIAEALLEDDRVTAIGLYLEGISDIEAFETFAQRARRRNKGVVVLKAGKSDAARSAALTHTASMAGSDTASRAFFRQLGIAWVDSLSQLIESLKLLHFIGPLGGREICSISCSGGEASVMADAAEQRRVTLRPLLESEKERVGSTLSELVSVSNPLDYHTFIWGDSAAMTRTFTAMVSSGFDLSMLVVDFPRRDRCDDSAWQCAVDAIIQVRRQTDANIAVVSSLAENLGETQAEAFVEHGIVPLQGIDDAMVAVEVAADIGSFLAGPAANLWPQQKQPAVTSVLNEYDAKLLLREAGIEVPAGVVVEQPAQSMAVAQTLGFPLVAKALGVDHKTEHNAVRLDLTDTVQLRQAVESLFASGSPVLVEQQIDAAVCELMLGIHCDEVYGPVLTLAAGGIWVEILKDTVTARLPVSEADVLNLLSSLRIWPILRGARGLERADTTAVVAAVMRLQSLFKDSPVIEIDINPLIVRKDGCGAVAADALISLAVDQDE